jgi:hypothetical protein
VAHQLPLIMGLERCRVYFLAPDCNESRSSGALSMKFKGLYAHSYAQHQIHHYLIIAVCFLRDEKYKHSNLFVIGFTLCDILKLGLRKN